VGRPIVMEAGGRRIRVQDFGFYVLEINVNANKDPRLGSAIAQDPQNWS
jgi:hypothetical protein